MDATQLYNDLTLQDIHEVLQNCPPEHQPGFHIPARLKRHKRGLLKKLLEAEPYWTETLSSIATDKQAHKLKERQARHAQLVEERRAARQKANAASTSGEFLDLPSQDEYFHSYAQFYRATSNEALRQFTCAVCARLLNAKDSKQSVHNLNELPNRHRLYPHVQHDAQTLIGGCLLESKGCMQLGTVTMVNVCGECLCDLQKHTDSPPKYSLANNLWIGPVPWSLECLTIAEQLLIARVYPRVFVVKLFPRDNSCYGLRDDQLQHALRGNVTSFELNSGAITKMIKGNLMPQKPDILATALKLFRVRREMVRNALVWLKHNNTKYYGDIDIDSLRLAELPADGLPESIRANIHHEEDDSMINAEADGYVPEDDCENEPEAAGLNIPASNDPESNDADVVPLQYLGVMDNDLSKISASELMTWGLYNTWKQNNDSEHGYAVRHGAPVNTFGQPPQGQGPADPGRRNFWETAFPLLYPYGLGGIECDRPVQLSLIEQVRWSLRYHDRRFRHHSTFIFVAFGIQQRQQALTSVRIQMKRRDFDSAAQTLSEITPEDLQRAAEEEERKETPSNPAIRLLKQFITATARRVMASDAARVQLRSQIWSTSMFFNPPTLWLTLNPDDLHDPIAQIFAGEEIDMDNFVNTAGPDNLRRSQNIARDPFAAAEFFHFLITTILEELFGITSTPSRVYARPGVLGRVKAYFGTVECQGRGTLHLHMLLWLDGAPPSQRLKQLLRTPEFRSKVVAYLKANVRAYLPQLATPAHLKAIPTNAQVAYSRIPNPSASLDTLLPQLDELELNVVRTKQIHKCVFGKCLRLDKHGKLSCKRRAPWEQSEDDYVEPDGTYHIRRTLGYLNSYCPALACTTKCNQDLKMLLHGSETKDIVFYVTKYMAKPEGRSHNAISLLAKGLMFHYQEDPHIKSLQDRQRDLIFRSVNVLNREQEVPAPLVVTHLMGWGDVYRSHQYSTIFWGSFVALIYRSFPNLRSKETGCAASKEPIPNKDSDESLLKEFPEISATATSTKDEQQHEDRPEEVILQFGNSGKLREKSQVDDYMYRGEETNAYNMLDYFTRTYEQSASRRQPNAPAAQQALHIESMLDLDEAFIQPPVTPRGRPAHPRVRYLPQHPRSDTHIRVVRPPGHNHIPNLVGPQFPRQSDPTQADIYAACILALLKPWRTLSEIKSPNQSWSDALSNFISSSEPHILDIINNLEHYHECRTAAEAKNHPGMSTQDLRSEEFLALHGQDSGLGSYQLSSLEITQDMVLKARRATENERDIVHGNQAVQIGCDRGIFSAPQALVKCVAVNATATDLETLKGWLSMIDLEPEVVIPQGHASGGFATADLGSVEQLNPQLARSNARYGDMTTDAIHEQPMDPIEVSSLLPEQKRAFDIVRWHLAQTLYAQNHYDHGRVPQLLMLLGGEGGTGKSRVIQTITQEFARQQVSHILIKAAYTGCAASLIEGKTTHRIGCVSVGAKKNQKLSPDSKRKLGRLWKEPQYLIIDEYSMLSKEFLAQLSRNIAQGKLEHNQSAGASSFGGVNVLLCGDLHQFPPVAVSTDGALYRPTKAGQAPAITEDGIGHSIYSKFQTVVMLKQQVRAASDPKYRDFLSSLRRGCVKDEDIQMLKKLTLTDPECVETNFESDQWKDCCLITPRNSVRIRWNDAAVKQHCRRSGHQLFICPANDTCVDNGVRRSLHLHEQFVAAKEGSGSKKSRHGRKEKNGLPDEVSIAIGLKIMVTLNVKTEIDVTNGARGVIVGIILDPTEPPIEPDQVVVTLSRLPAYILVKMDRTRAKALPGLSEGVIPIIPASKNYHILIPELQEDGNVKNVDRTVRRLQFPITPAYAFTDYRSQGQTISAAIVDIADPPTGRGLTSHNLYVALSRCPGRDHIRILRDFDHDILKRPLEYDLMKEDERLEELDSQTRIWWEKTASGSSSCS